MSGYWDAARLTSGGRSALRRCAGGMIGSADAAALLEFYRAVGGPCKKWEEEYWFAALSMEMLWRETDHPTTEPMESILRDMIHENTSESLMNRVRAALDTPWADDGFLLGKICNLARIIRAAHPERAPDFYKLADDLRDWNRENRRVQRKWIRTITTNTVDIKGEADTADGKGGETE